MKPGQRRHIFYWIVLPLSFILVVSAGICYGLQTTVWLGDILMVCAILMPGLALLIHHTQTTTPSSYNINSLSTKHSRSASSEGREIGGADNIKKKNPPILKKEPGKIGTQPTPERPDKLKLGPPPPLSLLHVREQKLKRHKGSMFHTPKGKPPSATNGRIRTVFNFMAKNPPKSIAKKPQH